MKLTKKLMLSIFTLFSISVYSQINVGGVKVPKVGSKKSTTTETAEPTSGSTNTGKTNTSTAEKESKPIYTEAEKKKLLDRTSFPSYSADSAFVKSINRKFNDNKMKLCFEFLDKDSIVIENCKSAKLRLDSMKLMYTDRWKVQKEMNIYSDLQQNYDKASKSITDLDNTIKNWSNSAPQYSRKIFSESMALATKCKNESKIYDSYGKDQFKALYANIGFTNTYIYTIKAVKGESDSTYRNLKKEQRATMDFLDKVYGDLEYQVLEKEVAPVEKYIGSDKEKHRAEIIKTWNASINPPKCDIGKAVKVYFIEDQWNNKTGIDWDNGGKNYDNSFLNVAIVTQDIKNPQKANVYYSYVTKDNLSGGKLDYSFCSCGANRKYSMLLKNISGVKVQ